MQRILTLALFLIVAVSVSARQPLSDDNPDEPVTVNSPANRQASRTKASLSIKGRVVESGGAPLADVSVMAFPANPLSNTNRSLSSLLRPVPSDSNGQFEITDLSAGSYVITVYAIGYITEESEEKVYYRPGDTATISLVKGGVITGTVTSSTGDKMVGVRVRATRIRDSKGRPVQADRGSSFSTLSSPASLMAPLINDWKTDDRGVYRIYGLEPGVYRVAAGGKGLVRISYSGYDSDVPTYYPSSTRDTASEVTVRAGEEVSNINIKYRNDQGSAVSGTVTGDVPSGLSSIKVQLIQAQSGAIEAASILPRGDSNHSFIFEVVPDGEYYLTALATSASALTIATDSSASRPRLVTVKGADVTGVELALTKLGSISGKFVVEPPKAPLPPEDCKKRRAASIEELILITRVDENKGKGENLVLALSPRSVSTPDIKGEFTLPLLESGLRRLGIEIPGEQWYAQSMVLPSTVPNGTPIDIARSGLRLNSGEHVKNVTIMLGEGAASLSGRVTSEGGENLPARMRVYLVPAESQSAEDALRYYEIEIETGGAFELKHLSPGRYWILARPVPDEELPGDDHRPLAWDSDGRTGLRFEGEAINTSIELKPCQHIGDYKFLYKPPVAPKAPPKKKGE